MKQPLISTFAVFQAVGRPKRGQRAVVLVKVYVKDRRQFEHPAENVDRFNPLRKVFVYGDERCAADEMAYVFFNVWKFPVDWRFYVTSAAFCGKTYWEKGFPIE